MSKLKKLAVTVAALAALAVGGAAFAQAQNASTPVAPTHQSIGEETTPGDTDVAKAGPDKADAPEGPNDPVDQGSQED